MIKRWVTIFLIGFTVAAIGAGFGAWLSWRAAGPLPGDDEARRVSALVAPGVVVQAVERHDVVYGGLNDGQLITWVLGADDYEAGYVEVVLGAGGAASEAVRAALARDGWQLVSRSGDGLAAQRGGIELWAYGDCDGAFCLKFSRVTPIEQDTLAVAGWGTGLIVGAVLTWVLLRHRPRLWGLLLLGGVLLAPATFAVTGELAFPAEPVAPDLPGALWAPYRGAGLQTLVLAGSSCWLIALLAGLAPRPDRREPAELPNGPQPGPAAGQPSGLPEPPDGPESR